MESQFNVNSEQPEWIVHTEEMYHDPDLRREYFDCMSKLDNISEQKWHFFRKMLNSYDFESHHYATNRAFYKLWEMLSNFPTALQQDTKWSLHIAEAPGSFVEAVKRKNPDCTTVAISKNPSTYAQVLVQSKTTPVFHRNILSLSGTQFMYADILEPTSFKSVMDKIRELSPKYAFITADGGIDEQRMYLQKEQLHYDLIFAEIVMTLLTQEMGGTCMIKIFETFTTTTLSIVYFLCSCYESFEIVKPLTSRPTNSERYVVCSGFRGCPWSEQVLLDLMKTNITSRMTLNYPLPETFQKLMDAKSREITQMQMDTIHQVITKIRTDTFIDRRDYHDIKDCTFKTWAKCHNLMID